jgi:hypothetical protein
MSDEQHSSPIAERSRAVAAVDSPPLPGKRAKRRVAVPLDSHRTVTVTGASRDLDDLIRALEAALGLARQARSLRVSLSTFEQMRADQSRAS